MDKKGVECCVPINDETAYGDDDLIEEFKGYWKVLKTNNEPNFNTLTTTQQQQVIKQIDSMISSKYEFIHYNGITRDAYLKMSGKENIFDNKLCEK